MQLIDHYPPNWAVETGEMIEAWLAHAEQPSVYLLVDAAFRRDTLYSWIQSSWPAAEWRALYQDSPKTRREVLQVSPLLLRIGRDDPKWRGRLDTLAELTSGSPMVSMIVTSESLSALWERFYAFRLVSVQKTRYVLRLSDTRRLPQVIEMLTPQQCGHLMQHMLAWQYVGRDSAWYALELPSIPVDIPARFEEIQCNDGQTQALVSMNRIDALIDDLRRNETELYEAFEQPSQRHDWLVETINEVAESEYPAQVMHCLDKAAIQGLI
ncbi:MULTISPECIES: DUF4123 domain-containing protein [unclassified Cobetia]|uniref:DUF4123 domain-containing protein n=1 Tax=unclassified Cobetia TaxID=2609414 RepID=UPI00178C99A8|nr:MULTISPECIES: DUF4123 domain-containing protein [unclassified Cobetia]MBE2167841.1 DUF4123 domain-containing protein [Cobetia sp. 2AS1]MDH2446264.1 DUF4123 domain-containing protein [Cobetia sp. 2AS]